MGMKFALILVFISSFKCPFTIGLCCEPNEVLINDEINPQTVRLRSNGRPVSDSTFVYIEVRVRFPEPIYVNNTWKKLNISERSNLTAKGNFPVLGLIGNIKAAEPVHKYNTKSLMYSGSSNSAIRVKFVARKKFFSNPFYLVLGGGKVFCLKSNTSVSTTILGKYILENTTWYKTYKDKSETFKGPSLYCQKETERYQEFDRFVLSKIRGKFELDEVKLYSANAELNVHLPLTIKGNLKELTMPLPEIVTANYRNQKVTVELPPSRTIIVTDEKTVVTIPVSKIHIPILFERTYNVRPESVSSGRLTAKRCPPGSPRNEYMGISDIPQYHLLEQHGLVAGWIPNPDVHQWNILSGTKINYADTTEKLRIAEYEDLEEGEIAVSEEIVKALTSYILIEPEIGSWPLPNFQMIKDQQNIKMTIPVDLIKGRSCGKLNVSESAFFNQEDFCSKPIGSCVGLPIYSSKRFPMRFPFGLKESIKVEVYKKKAITGDCQDETYIKLTQYYKNVKKLHLKVPAVGILEPYLFKTKNEWLKSNTIDEEVFCKSTWSILPNIHQQTKELTATVIGKVQNLGKGTASTLFKVKCSRGLSVESNEHGKVTIKPNSIGIAEILLVGEKAIGEEKAWHNCELNIVTDYYLFGNSMGKILPTCHFRIPTFFGAFTNPCNEEAQPLPSVMAIFHYIPQEEIDVEKLQQVKKLKFLGGFTLVRAVSVRLKVPQKEQGLLYNIHEKVVVCENRDYVVMGDMYTAMGSGDSEDYNQVVYKRELLKTKQIFIFIKEGADSTLPSYCQVQLRARRPHVACPNTETIYSKKIIISKRDIQEDVEDILSRIFGVDDSVIIALLACLITSLVFFGLIGSGHLTLLSRRKKLPSQSQVDNLKGNILRVKREEKKKWENPNTFLEQGPHGPYFMLHNFKTTEPLDVDKLNTLKVAGLLKYKDKTLPVVFGHVKKIHVDTTILKESGSSARIWIQASSGMYLLEYDQAEPGYRLEVKSFLEKYSLDSEK